MCSFITNNHQCEINFSQNLAKNSSGTEVYVACPPPPPFELGPWSIGPLPTTPFLYQCIYCSVSFQLRHWFDDTWLTLMRRCHLNKPISSDHVNSACEQDTYRVKFYDNTIRDGLTTPFSHRHIKHLKFTPHHLQLLHLIDLNAFLYYPVPRWCFYQKKIPTRRWSYLS